MPQHEIVGAFVRHFLMSVDKRPLLSDTAIFTRWPRDIKRAARGVRSDRPPASGWGPGAPPARDHPPGADKSASGVCAGVEATGASRGTGEGAGRNPRLGLDTGPRGRRASIAERDASETRLNDALSSLLLPSPQDPCLAFSIFGVEGTQAIPESLSAIVFAPVQPP
jgi:hypothetical protein